MALGYDLIYCKLVSEALHLHPGVQLHVMVIEEEPGVRVQRIGLISTIPYNPNHLGRDICGGHQPPSLRREELEDLGQVVDDQPYLPRGN